MHIVDNELKIPRLYDTKSYDVLFPIFIYLSLGLNSSEKFIFSKKDESYIVEELLFFKFEFLFFVLVLIILFIFKFSFFLFFLVDINI